MGNYKRQVGSSEKNLLIMGNVSGLLSSFKNVGSSDNLDQSFKKYVYCESPVLWKCNIICDDLRMYLYILTRAF